MEARRQLVQLYERLGEAETVDEAQLSQRMCLGVVLDRLEDNPEAVRLTPPAEPPMGAPI